MSKLTRKGSKEEIEVSKHILGVQKRAYKLYYRREYLEAEPLFRQVLTSKVEVFGRDHASTSQTRHDLARTLFEIEKYAEAEPLYGEILRSGKITDGLEQSKSLQTQYEYACILRQLDRFEEAAALHRQVLESRKHEKGSEHNTTLDSQYELAQCLRVLERYEEAERLLRQTWEIERVLRPDHKDTWGTQEALAHVLVYLSRYEESEALYRQTLTAWREVLGLDHERTLKCQLNLGCVLLTYTGQYHEAEQLFVELWSILERMSGVDAALTRSSLIYLSLAFLAVGKYAEALEYGQTALQSIIERPLGKSDDDEIWVRKLLAEAYFENGQDIEAERMFESIIQGNFAHYPKVLNIVKLCLKALSPDRQVSTTVGPNIDQALRQEKGFPRGPRLLEAIDKVCGDQRSSKRAQTEIFSYQETASFVTCQESQSFLEQLVPPVEPSTIGVETLISPIKDEDVIPTTLELDIYHAKPNHVNFMTRDGHLDTQAGADCISIEMAEMLGHKIEEYKGGAVLTAAGPIKALGQISLFFEWRKSKLTKRIFLVIENLPVDIVLGIGFIREFKVYSLGDALLVMALSPLKKEEKKQLEAMAGQNRRRRDAEEKLEEEQNRAKRQQQLMTRNAQHESLNDTNGQEGTTVSANTHLHDNSNGV